MTPEERATYWRELVKRLPDTKPLSDEAISRESITPSAGERPRRHQCSAATDTAFLYQPRGRVESIDRLLTSGKKVHFTLQNIAEFWNVALPDTPAMYAERRLAASRRYGRQSARCRLVAAMNVHGVKRPLTFNAGNFARYGIEVLRPASVLSQAT